GAPHAGAIDAELGAEAPLERAVLARTGHERRDGEIDETRGAEPRVPEEQRAEEEAEDLADLHRVRDVRVRPGRNEAPRGIAGARRSARAAREFLPGGDPDDGRELKAQRAPPRAIGSRPCALAEDGREESRKADEDDGEEADDVQDRARLDAHV